MPREDYTPEVVVSTDGISREEWLEYRRQGIGGSDVAAILGVSPYATARDLFYNKLKIASFDDDNANWIAKEVGNLLEDLVAQIFQMHTGHKVYKIKKMFRHPRYPFMVADIDYFFDLPNGKRAILECKTGNSRAPELWWLDEVKTVPINYMLQGRHYMSVMNIDEVHYCCLHGNSENEVIIRQISRNYAFEDELIALEGDYWNNHILRRIPPPYLEENGELILKSIRHHFGPADPTLPAIELPHIFGTQVERYLELQSQKAAVNAQLKAIEGEMKRLQGRVVAEMGKGCSATCQQGENSYAITYNPIYKHGISKENLTRLEAQHPEIYDEYVSISESRRFTVKRQNAA